MQGLKTRRDFFTSEEGLLAKQKLEFMMGDSTYCTVASYTSDSEQYPDNLMPFVDKHMNYLNAHPSLDMQTYLTNLRLMTRLR